MVGDNYLDDTLRQLRKYKRLAEDAIAQIDDEWLFSALDSGSNSIAIVMQHMAGNMRSRWTRFLTTDGEKPDRYRDREFEPPARDKAALLEHWEAGWRTTIDAISALDPADLERTVTIRGEPHTVVEAIQRQLTHYAYHVGQIVLLARHYAPTWRSLSIPKGKSAELDVSKAGVPYTPR